MIMKLRYRLGGGHTHVTFFMGVDKDHLQNCGDLCFRNEEWKIIRSALEKSDASGEMILFEEKS